MTHDMVSKAKRKQKSNASTEDSCHRSLTGGDVMDSLADLLKIIKLEGVCAENVKEVWEILQHLF